LSLIVEPLSLIVAPFRRLGCARQDSRRLLGAGLGFPGTSMEEALVAIVKGSGACVKED
jgi:hypothetical protein